MAQLGEWLDLGNAVAPAPVRRQKQKKNVRLLWTRMCAGKQGECAYLCLGVCDRRRMQNVTCVMILFASFRIEALVFRCGIDILCQFPHWLGCFRSGVEEYSFDSLLINFDWRWLQRLR